MAPTPDDFRALARSSPWRWHSLVFDFHIPRNAGWSRCWIRRPGSIRVESDEDELLFVDGPDRRPPWAARIAGLWHRAPGPHQTEGPFVPLDPRAPQPVVDERGLVVERPVEADLIRYDDPMYQDYRWVAMLDPVELADGLGSRRERSPAMPAVQLGDLVEVVHHGRDAWQAIAIPRPSYEARCPCCPLLDSGPAAAKADAVFGDEPPSGDGDDTRHCVTLDIETGICVFTKQLDGERRGNGHDLRIVAVDAALPDSLFLR